MKRLLSLLLALALTLPLLTAPALAEDGERDVRVAKYTAFVDETLAAGDLKYRVDEDDPTRFILTYSPKDGRLGDIYVFIDIYGGGALIWASYEDDLPPEAVDEAIRYVNLVNGRLLGRKYYIFPNTGSVIYELYFFMDVDSLGDYETRMLLGLLDSIVIDIDYDTEYFVAVINGETAENAFAMYEADLEN